MSRRSDSAAGGVGGAAQQHDRKSASPAGNLGAQANGPNGRVLSKLPATKRTYAGSSNGNQQMNLTMEVKKNIVA